MANNNVFALSTGSVMGFSSYYYCKACFYAGLFYHTAKSILSGS